MAWLWCWLIFGGTALDDAPEAPPSLAPLPPIEALPLDETNFAQWRDYLRPSASEQQFEEIPWRLELGAAIREAHESGKPLLVWAMNGHPFGCT